MHRCRGPLPTPRIHDTEKSSRSTSAMSKLPMTATYAVLESGETAMPRGYGPSGTLSTCLLLWMSMMLRLYEHQLLTSRYFWSGVTARYLGTAPTGMTLSTSRVSSGTRKT